MDESELNEKYPGRRVYREGDRIVISIPVQFRRRNGRRKIHTIGGEQAEKTPSGNHTLIVALAKAWHWQGQLEAGEYRSVEDLAAAIKMDVSYVRRMIRLTSLAPEIVEGLLNNRGPENLSLAQLHRGIPLRWIDCGPSAATIERC